MKVAFITALAGSAVGPGCAQTRYLNTASPIKRYVRAHHDGTRWAHFKSAVLYPARDIVTGDPLWRALFKDEAWNVQHGKVANGPFFIDSDVDELTPEKAGQGHGLELFPRQPLRIDRVKKLGATPGFFGTDAEGRKYLVKLDDPDYPELGSSASIIATRVYHALGYHVPPVFLVTIEGTGDSRFDGRRATVSPMIAGVLGQFQFDWFRHRREVRAIRLVAAWLNDTDRGPNNNLVVVEGDVARYYLIDFNSALGSWQGRPKEPWRGWRHVAGSGDGLVRALTFGLVRPAYDPHQPMVSPAVGRFDAEYDPMTWAAQVANTAFDQMTAEDRDWIIERIGQLKRAHLEAIVAAAGLSRAQDREYLVETLLARQAKLVALGATK